MPADSDEVRRRLGHAEPRLYVGAGEAGTAFAGHQQAVLVLGPPRSGKTTTLVVPNVLWWPGAVVSTSTKPDVMAATAGHRRQLGRCWLFDPSGSTQAPAGVQEVRWSPVAAAVRWEEALLTARAMVGAARPGQSWGEAAHWTERAEALLAPLFHAAALSGAAIGAVVRWVLRRDLGPARATLAGHGAAMAADVLAGLAATDEREMSGIWSTAAGVLAAYRSTAAVAAGQSPNVEVAELSRTTDTVYICAPARAQALVAPIVVAFLEQVRAGAFRAAAAGAGRLPVVLALDEVANVAPLPDLPALVSEGGGQGVMTLACLQDLSQARHRWGRQADGFLSLFGTKVILGGIADLSTLEQVSRLGGEVDVARRSVSRGPWWGPGRGAPTLNWSPHRQRRLPVDALNQLPPGRAVVISGWSRPGLVWLPPWWEAGGAGRPRPPLAPSPDPPPPPGPAGPAPGEGRVRRRPFLGL
ncbi:MAG TPA: type IV secretory system conjugative DNA transfer family protein [Acidimicrobiales bacterium]|nr:type IV secretory system conjugative DNA transfer family protein [Acidimicrobiales bacterium]